MKMDIKMIHGPLEERPINLMKGKGELMMEVIKELISGAVMRRRCTQRGPHMRASIRSRNDLNLCQTFMEVITPIRLLNLRLPPPKENDLRAGKINAKSHKASPSVWALREEHAALAARAKVHLEEPRLHRLKNPREEKIWKGQLVIRCDTHHKPQTIPKPSHKLEGHRKNRWSRTLTHRTLLVHHEVKAEELEALRSGLQAGIYRAHYLKMA